MTADLRIEVGGAVLVHPILEPVCALYDEVFSAPPFFWREDESELHRQRLVRLLDDPTFGVAVAQAGEELVGFAYGFQVPPDTTRWVGLIGEVSPELAREWPGRTFLLFDYGVQASMRGYGIGRKLHDGLLGSRPEERATLTVQPTAKDTKAIYERWGWRQVGRVEGGPASAAPLFDVYVRESLDDLRAAAQAIP